MGRITARTRVTRITVGGRTAQRDDVVAVEEPLEIRVGRSPLAVTMRTPGHDVDLTDLRELPLRITDRRTNPPLVDLVMSACAAAGFEPVLGPRSNNLQDTHAAIGAGAPSWTVIYESHARLLREGRVVFRRPHPRLALTTSLAVPAGTTVGGDLAVLLEACRRASDQFE